jgi:hypothetical protein
VEGEAAAREKKMKDSLIRLGLDLTAEDNGESRDARASTNNNTNENYIPEDV